MCTDLMRAPKSTDVLHSDYRNAWCFRYPIGGKEDGSDSRHDLTLISQCPCMVLGISIYICKSLSD